MNTSNTVSLLIPLEAEYVSIARLTASGIANHVGFDFDTIEDIKVALSEVMSKIIEKQTSDKNITIDFIFIEDGLSITFKLADQNISGLFNNDDDNFALAIISTLMDEVNLQEKDHAIVTLVKKLGKAV